VPGFGVIAAVSETLETVLKTAVSGLGSTAELSNLQGNIPTSPARLTIFLFEVAEDPSACNKPRTRRSVGQNIELRKPPMALVLRYLVTAWGGTRLTEHTLLGRALQALYDGALISPPVLSGPVWNNTHEVLKVTLLPLTLEERTRVWYSVQRPYRLSLYYEVRVVNLDSETFDSRASVQSRGLDYASAEAAS
jgi:Pvc16 N-terminal domain